MSQVPESPSNSPPPPQQQRQQQQSPPTTPRLLPVPRPSTDNSRRSFKWPENEEEGRAIVVGFPAELASADFLIAPDGTFVETSIGAAAMELKRRYDSFFGVNPSVQSPYAITALVNHHGRRVFRIGSRDYNNNGSNNSGSNNSGSNNSGSNNIGSGSTRRPYSRLSQIINISSGQFFPNNQGAYGVFGFIFPPDSRKRGKPLARSKPTSALDKVEAADQLMDEEAALKDLKAVEQRLEANDFLDWEGDEAQKLLDRFHRASEVATSPTREKLLEKMNEFSKKSNILPSCLWIQHGVTKLDLHAVDKTGAYATVWRGMIGKNSEIVALKIIDRHIVGKVEKFLGELIRETLVWRQLDHKNILPFKGAYLFNKPREICLVSPWMETGNLPNFIKNNPCISPELQYNFALDIASGLAYLHGQGITHGNIKGNNILIDDKSNARITDYGLSRIANATLAATSSTSRGNALGPVRWQAPELLMDDAIPTSSSDVYAYGSTLQQIYAKMVPFHGFTDIMVVLWVLTQEKLPERVEGAFPDPMWEMMRACWEKASTERPVASKIVDLLKSRSFVQSADPSMTIPSQNQVDYGPQNKDGSSSQHMRDSREMHSLIHRFTATAPEPRKALWSAIAGVGASHKAEEQFSRGLLLPGSRTEVLGRIRDWRVSAEEGPPICWLSGSVGSGKTAIVLTVANSCGDELLCSFFFLRSDPKRNHPSALMLTIAHALVAKIPALRDLIYQKISEDPTVLEAIPEVQFQELVAKPILSRRHSSAEYLMKREDPNLIIIDGLDDFGDQETQSDILRVVLSAYQQTPFPPLRFLISSRPVPGTRQALGSSAIIKHITLDGTSSADIKLYYNHEFLAIRTNSEHCHVRFPDPWPSKEDLRLLVYNSGDQFAYASAAVKFVKIPYSHPVKQLRIILDGIRDFPPSLDRLFHIILNANPVNDKVRRILGAILILPPHIGLSPSPELIELLLNLPSGDVTLSLSAMLPLLDIRRQKDGICLHQTSFSEFLSDSDRSGQFYIDRHEQHHHLAEQWLQALSHSRMGGYSLNQLYRPQTSLLFTQWISFCISLPKPSQDLLRLLRGLDLSALFHCLLLLDSHRPRNILEQSRQSGRGYPTWHETFKPMVEWLETGPVDSGLMERFRNHPMCFHLELSPDVPQIQDDILHWSILRLTGCESRSSTRVRADMVCTAYEEESKYPFPLRITGCYCEDRMASDDPGHRAYQDACLKTAKALISDFSSAASAERSPTSIINDVEFELTATFRNLANSSLLQHCIPEPELCSTFFTALLGCSSISLEVTLASGESEKRLARLLNWLERCPDPLTVTTFKPQVTSLFGLTDVDA
ncbi:Rho guanine nucleotide exchange factor [Marasmius crinis-equi]|uniref:Rho guanine nucleotide exchange factor n=1 Tax=Marasmius crinis-equi TaxID=585013 RepID=A0ABR3F9W4_9AGAR